MIESKKTELQNKVDSFKWYHEIEVEPGVMTKPVRRFPQSWELILDGMNKINLEGKTVLDIGARDGQFSFIAESMGAKKVVAIDNDPSPGGQWLKQYRNSAVELRNQNLYDVPAVERYDVVLFFGVLYHLRYPMTALRKISKMMPIGGNLFIETGIMDRYDEYPLIYCPVRKSPYEQTSCTFFNGHGLGETLWSMGITQQNHAMHSSENGEMIRRIWIEAKKTHEMPKDLKQYWEGTHHSHA